MSVLYKNEDEKFSFAYPKSWGKMTVVKGKEQKSEKTLSFLTFSFSTSPNQFSVFFDTQKEGKKWEAYNGKTYVLANRKGSDFEIFALFAETANFF